MIIARTVGEVLRLSQKYYYAVEKDQKVVALFADKAAAQEWRKDMAPWPVTATRMFEVFIEKLDNPA